MICVVYAYDLRNKEIKTVVVVVVVVVGGGGGSPFLLENGGRSKSKNWRQNTFLSRSRTLKKFNVSIYGHQKYDLKYGPSVHIKKGSFQKSAFHAKHHFFCLDHKY